MHNTSLCKWPPIHHLPHAVPLIHSTTYPHCSHLVYMSLSSASYCHKCHVLCGKLSLKHSQHTCNLPRASNINWSSVPVPECSRELWDELAQGITANDFHLMERLENSRRCMLNEAKRSRKAAFRATTLDREAAETKLYEDQELFYNKNKVIYLPLAHLDNCWFNATSKLVNCSFASC